MEWRDIDRSAAEDMIRNAAAVSPRDWDELEITGKDGAKAMLWMPVIGSPKLRSLSAQEARVAELEADLATARLFISTVSSDEKWKDRAQSILGVIA